MKPVAGNALDKSCGDAPSSNCVLWAGPDIPCLSICKGSSITPVMYQLAVMVCAINGELDISSLDLGCLWTPTVTVWACPAGQTFIPDAAAFAVNGTAGFCQLCPVPTGCFITTAVPTSTTVANPVSKPVTLVEVLQLIVNRVPCCDPCTGRLNPGS